MFRSVRVVSNLLPARVSAFRAPFRFLSTPPTSAVSTKKDDPIRELADTVQFLKNEAAIGNSMA
jgi:hypothetical protein